MVATQAQTVPPQATPAARLPVNQAYAQALSHEIGRIMNYEAETGDYSKNLIFVLDPGNQTLNIAYRRDLGAHNP